MNLLDRSRHRALPPLALALTLPMFLLAGCAANGAPADQSSESAGTTHDENSATEAAGAKPRLAVTHDGGIQVLDATTLKVVGQADLDGFNRLNGAGDGRNLLVSTAGGFQVLDAGAWAEPHGDHSHFYTAEPRLTDVAFDAEKPGHVVVHRGRTALFDDGTGRVVVVDSGDVADPDRPGREYTTPSPHHGVAIELADGSLVVSHGTEEERTGIRVLDAHDKQLAASDECPGVHGEAIAADEAVVIGCEDGALIYSGGTISKASSPDAYGRIGNQAGSEASPVVLGDYKSDPDAVLERPTRVSLIDTRTGELKLVDLPASYSFRSLGRGENGEALVLGTDGQLRVIDPESGKVVRSVPVIKPWKESEVWQEPRPTLFALDGSAYVTDPSTDMIHAVDIETGEIWNSAELTITPNELNGTSGDAPADELDGQSEHADS